MKQIKVYERSAEVIIYNVTSVAGWLTTRRHGQV